MKIIYFIFFVSIFSTRLLADTAPLKKVNLTSAEYPPYYGEHLKNQGPVSEIIKHAFANVNYETEIAFYPWARSEFFAKKGGKFQGMFPPWHTKQREEFFLFSDPIFANIIGFYKHKNSNVIASRDLDLSNFTIGAVTGYADPQSFEDTSVQKYFVINDTRNLQMLCKQRVDLIVIDKLSAHHILTKQLPECFDQLEWVEPALEFKDQHLAISLSTHNAQLIIKDFNKGLQQLKNSGEMKKILKKHGLYKALLKADVFKN